MLKRIEAVGIAKQDLQRDEDHEEPKREPQHHAPFGERPPAPYRIGTDTKHDKSRSHVEGADRMGQPERK